MFISVGNFMVESYPSKDWMIAPRSLLSATSTAPPSASAPVGRGRPITPATRRASDSDATRRQGNARECFTVACGE